MLRDSPCWRRASHPNLPSSGGHAIFDRLTITQSIATVGVDVGTRVAIYELVRDLCEGGAGILLISSDLPEILHLTNRTYVMYRGELRAELEGAQITEDRVLANFFERAQA